METERLAEVMKATLSVDKTERDAAEEQLNRVSTTIATIISPKRWTTFALARFAWSLFKCFNSELSLIFCIIILVIFPWIRCARKSVLLHRCCKSSFKIICHYRCNNRRPFIWKISFERTGAKTVCPILLGAWNFRCMNKIEIGYETTSLSRWFSHKCWTINMYTFKLSHAYIT